MFNLNIANDKLYIIGIIGAIIIIVFILIGNSMYIKNCVKTELYTIKKIDKKKRKIFEKKQRQFLLEQKLNEQKMNEQRMNEQRMNEQQLQMLQAEQLYKQKEHRDADVDSYVDPIAENSGNQYHDYQPDNKTSSPLSRIEMDAAFMNNNNNNNANNNIPVAANQ